MSICDFNTPLVFGRGQHNGHKQDPHRDARRGYCEHMGGSGWWNLVVRWDARKQQ